MVPELETLTPPSPQGESFYMTTTYPGSDYDKPSVVTTSATSQPQPQQPHSTITPAQQAAQKAAGHPAIQGTEPIPTKSLQIRTDKPRPHVCLTCTRSFARLEHLKRHERSHTKERPFQCPICERCFARRDLLLRHRQKLHANFPESPKGKVSRRRSSVAVKQESTNAVAQQVNQQVTQSMSPPTSSMSGVTPSMSGVTPAMSGVTSSMSPVMTMTQSMSPPPAFTNPFDKNMFSDLLMHPENHMDNDRELRGRRTRPASFSASSSASYLRDADIDMLKDKFPIDDHVQVEFSTPQLAPATLANPDYCIDEVLLSQGQSSFVNPRLLNHESPEDGGMKHEPLMSMFDVEQVNDDFDWMSQYVEVGQGGGQGQHNQGNPQHDQSQGQHDQSQGRHTPGNPQHGQSHPPHNPLLAQSASPIISFAPSDMILTPPNSMQFHTNFVPGQMDLDHLDLDLDMNGHTINSSEDVHTFLESIGGGQQGQGGQQGHHSGPHAPHSQPSLGAQNSAQHSGHPNLGGLGSDSSHSPPTYQGPIITPQIRLEILNVLSTPTPYQTAFKLPNTADLQRYVVAFQDHFAKHLPFLHSTLEFSNDNIPLALCMAAIGARYLFEFDVAQSIFEVSRCCVHAYLERRRGKSGAATNAAHETTGPTNGAHPAGATNAPNQGVNSSSSSSLGGGGGGGMGGAGGVGGMGGSGVGIGAGMGSGSGVGSASASGSIGSGSSDTPIWLIQALTLGVVYGLFSDDALVNDIAVAQASAVVSLARAAGLHLPAHNFFSLPGPDSSVQDKWHYFINVQTRIRTLHAIHALSCLVATGYNVCTSLKNSDIVCGSPCDESLWSSQCASEWWDIVKRKELDGSLKTTVGGPSYGQCLTSLIQGHTLVDKIPQFTLLSLMYGALLEISERRKVFNRNWHGSHDEKQRAWLNLQKKPIESFLRTWETTWSMSPLASLSPNSQYGPLMSDAIPLSSLAHVRTYVDLQPVKEAFARKNFQLMGEELGRLDDGMSADFHGLLEAASYSADSISLWEKHSVRWTMETLVSQTFIHALMAIFDCGLVVSEFFRRLELKPKSMWTDAEAQLWIRMSKILFRVCESVKDKDGSIDLALLAIDNLPSPEIHNPKQRLSLLTLHVVSKMLTSVYVWPYMKTMAEALRFRARQIR